MTFPWLQSAREQFNQQMASGRQAHALLLSGPAGLGKIQLAGEMAAALLCMSPQQPGNDLIKTAAKPNMACGKCRSCQLFATGAHPDFRRLSFVNKKDSDELRSEIVIDQIRELNSVMQLTRGLSPRKLAMIYPAEAMNRNASNALLKTLEEPPGDAVLILVSNDSARLPATIRSRCQAIPVRPPSLEEARSWLVENASMDEKSATLALQAAAGSPLLALNFAKHNLVEEYQLLMESLEQIDRNAEAVGFAFDKLSKLDQVQLWNWLALACADRLRSLLGLKQGSGAGASRSAHSIFTSETHVQQARRLSDLSRKANLNRRLMSTPVRKDLLLRDWLLQWGSPTSS